MAQLTLLEIIQKAQGELSLPVCTSVIDNIDQTTTNMFYLANRLIDDLRRDYRWTALQFEYNLAVQVPVVTTGNTGTNSAVITNIADLTGVEAYDWTVAANSVPQASRVLSVDSATQITMTMEATEGATGGTVTFARDTYPMPSDFDYQNPATWWDRTNQWALLGPDSPQLDQFHRSGVVATGPRRHFRQIGPYASKYRLWPAPAEITAPIQLVFEYLSTNSVSVNGSSTEFAQYFANDDDIPLLDSNAIIMGIKYLFWQVKGMNYVPFQNIYVDYVDQLQARDGSAPTLNLSPMRPSMLLSPWNVQDGNWPGSSSS